MVRKSSLKTHRRSVTGVESETMKVYSRLTHRPKSVPDNLPELVVPELVVSPKPISVIVNFDKNVGLKRQVPVVPYNDLSIQD